MIAKLKQRAHHLKAETFALYIAARDPRTPWYAKLLVAGIVAYAFSPIDLIPDFVPGLSGWFLIKFWRSAEYGHRKLYGMENP